MKSVIDRSREGHTYVRPDAARRVVVSVSMPVLMRRTRGRHRIWVAVAAVVFQLALGSVYSWSVFARALREPGSTFAFDATRATLPFSVAVGMVFVGTWCGGRLQERHGSRVTAMIGAGIYSAGIIACSAARDAADLWVLILCYGVVSGVGLGIGYIVPTALLQRWFPDKRGLITGISVGGFGLGPVLSAPVLAALVHRYETVPTQAFLPMGLLCAAMTLPAAWLFVNPPASASASVVVGRSVRPSFTGREALRSREWYLLATILFASALAGISLVSVLAPAAHAISGYDAGSAAALTAAAGVFNGVGRPLAGAISERAGRMRTFAVLLVVQGLALLALPWAHDPALFAVLVCAVSLANGGGFGTMPATAGDFFGVAHIGAVYGPMLVSWSLAGVIGPLTTAHLASDGYTTAFVTVGVVTLAAVTLTAITRPPVPRTM
ncbi:OFA family MFS transporter [Streptomyces acidiscabies]|uniref:OFA family MFS transporter n=1 Tax=Streptomyces acidiscabies TaxID=42234 RepID=UPI00073F2554|nr:OFA family MFS transporter [Streptomyces acidiscabies]GAQ53949.1 putative MFS-type transporter YhjX [Streptomyces acidiscabies]